MEFLDIRKVAARYGANYISTPYGSYGTLGLDKKRCRKLRLWIGISGTELKVSPNLIGCGNEWLDELAADIANERVRVDELV